MIYSLLITVFTHYLLQYLLITYYSIYCTVPPPVLLPHSLCVILSLILIFAILEGNISDNTVHLYFLYPASPGHSIGSEDAFTACYISLKARAYPLIVHLKQTRVMVPVLS